MQSEKYGIRDLTYSRWHRTLGVEFPTIDIDWVEYCNYCERPLALIETAIDVGQSYKATKVTAKLAECAKLPAFLVLYEKIVIDDERCRIGKCRVKRVWPEKDAEFFNFTAERLGKTIKNIHAQCGCADSKKAIGSYAM